MVKIKSINPSTGNVIGEVPASSEQDVKEKVKLARSAQKSWQEIGLTGRVKKLKQVVQLFVERKDDFAKLISEEMGMPITQAVEDVSMGIDYFEWYLDNAEKYLTSEVTYEDEREIHRVFYEPVGVVASIVPWNFPFSNFVWQVGQNLVVGNTVVFKHSEETVLVGKEIEKVFDDSQVPKGVFNELYGGGDVGNLLVNQDIDMICFTGSSEVGKELYKLAGEKFIRVLMELGGSAPGIVFEDADVDKIVETIYFNKFLNCGQVCDGLKRLIVHESRFDEVVEKLKRVVVSKKVGLADKKETDIGPLVSERQVEVLKLQVKDAVSKGARVIIGGKESENSKGFFYEPTLLTKVTKDMRVWNEEVFGPVLPIVSFKTYDEAIILANDTNYGLGGYVFTEDKQLAKKAASEIKTGMVGHNNVSYLKPCNPFGGYKNSGFGREHGKFGFHELCQVKVVSFEKN